MKTIRIKTLFTPVLVAGLVVLALSLAAAASDTPKRRGQLHVIKDCTAKTGDPGSFCIVTSSDLPEIVVGSKVFYFQSPIGSTGLQDSNVVLDAGNGNRAVGRCTLDLSNGLGLCTFSDGTGQFTGFQARVDVSPPTDGVNWHWEGTDSFRPEPDR